ncbi:MAG: hypothetical protein QG656_1711 [Candidatus Hydrogenedentes bacterium]|nr:hypothetical protein [Candidatus Hydrogenedentota bacterium]
MWTLLLSVSLAGAGTAAEQPPFESLGIPVMKAGLMGVLVGPGPVEGTERIYFNFRQDGGKLFLVAVDPETDAAEQYNSPVGSGAWGFITGPDGRIYLGTHEGPDPGDSGQILAFDPKHPEKGIEIVGRPSETETYLWMFTVGTDGKIYGCTYGNAKLVSYDPKTGALADLGRMDDTQLYTRSICTGPDGRIYIGVGFGQANLVVYDPKKGDHKSILPAELLDGADRTLGTVYRGTDGEVYATVQGVPDTFVVKGDTLEKAPSPAPAAPQTTLKDGRIVQNVQLDGTYDLARPDGTVEHKRFTYKGAGSGIFMVNTGPLGRIYGGTAMPNELFWYDPATGEMQNPGNPTEVGGEIYSMLDHHGLLYVCAYPGSFLSKWDPAQPWNYGREASNNPRGFGPLGVGHLRPRAMIHGPGEKIYIGSFPEYGKLGGSLGVWDPETDTLAENYHHLIPNQSIVSLAYDPDTSLVFGGSSTTGGGGSTPSETEAKFFAFSAETKALAFSETPYPGENGIRTLVRAGRRIFGVAGGNQLFVYDIDKREYVHKAVIAAGTVVDCGMGLWKDGQIYGLSGKRVFRLNPETFEETALAEYDGQIHCGFAMDDHGIYFGDRATLMRYNWAK